MKRYTIMIDSGDVQEHIENVIDKPTIQLSNTPTNSKGEITSSDIEFSFSNPTIEGESTTLVKNNLRLTNLNRNLLVLNQDTTESSITVSNSLEGDTNYNATLTQYVDEHIEAYSELKFKTAEYAPFNISSEQLTIRQGDSFTIPFTNDNCSLAITSEFNLVNITQNTDNLVLKAVTNDMGSDHITITASKNGYIDKEISITIIVPDVIIESDLVAVQLNESNPYSDITVTTNGDDISYTISEPNIVISQISETRAQNNDLVRVYRIEGICDGSSIITFNSLVDDSVVETCTCGCTVSDKQFIDFTASTNGNNINFFVNTSNFNTSDYDVYINGTKTSQVFNSLTFNANDKIQIKANKKVNFYPCFYAQNKNYIKSINLAFPLMSPNNTTALTSFKGCFASCRSLTSIPSDLFKYNTQVANFRSCFEECVSLTSISQDLFKDSNNDNSREFIFDYCFSNCSGIISNVPELWVTYSATAQHYRCFKGCTNAANYGSIPSGWR